MLWKGFQRPKRLEFERETANDRFDCLRHDHQNTPERHTCVGEIVEGRPDAVSEILHVVCERPRHTHGG